MSLKFKRAWKGLIKKLKEDKKTRIGAALVLAAGLVVLSVFIYFSAFYTGWMGIPRTACRIFVDHGRLLRHTWIKSGDCYSYTDENGRPTTGRITIDGSYYCFDKDGVMQTGWAGRRYYDEYGRGVTSWQEIDGKTYYFDNKGLMQKGWVKYEGDVYYLADDGAMAKGWTVIFGRKYRFDDDGVMQTGLYKEGDKTYLLSSLSGELLTGEQVLDGKHYLADDQGVVQTGWHGSKYYQEDGSAASGWTDVDGKLRCFDEAGEMRTGLFTEGDEEFYTEEDGSVEPGWKDGFYVCRDGFVIRPDAGTGDYGRLYIRSQKINTALYLAASRRDYQKITDADDSALVVKERHDLEPVIADRKSQGFDLSGLQEGDFAYVLGPEGDVSEYTCVRLAEGTNEGRDVTDDKGDSLWQQNEGGICTYSSAGKEDKAKVIAAFWKAS